MKRKLAAAIITIFGLGLLGAPSAQADINAIDPYLTALSKQGFTLTEKSSVQLAILGLNACVDMFNGITPDEVTESVIDLTDLPEEGARAIVNTARKTLCPTAIGGTRV